jgi:hypothetical protein
MANTYKVGQKVNLRSGSHVIEATIRYVGLLGERDKPEYESIIVDWGDCYCWPLSFRIDTGEHTGIWRWDGPTKDEWGSSGIWSYLERDCWNQLKQRSQRRAVENGSFQWISHTK